MVQRLALCLIVAIARNRVIGQEGGLPWRLRDDFRWFKQTTLGFPIIMGRKTWESLPIKPLPGRTNLVVSRWPERVGAGAEAFASPQQALVAAKAMARREKRDKVFIIGGGSLYRWALPKADMVFVSRIDADIVGDTVFPPMDMQEWEELYAHNVGASEQNSHAFKIQVLNRLPHIPAHFQVFMDRSSG